MTESRPARLAGLAVVVMAGALSTAWALLVPIFQAPDEPAHFDYAISIYSAHRLITLRDGSTDWIVSPYTKYLLRMSDFERIAKHSTMRAPPGYGSSAYFARVDAEAPSLRRLPPATGKINYIVPAYPFGFYALEALWMHAVSAFTGSISALFFSARLLCVFLTMVGLYFNYRTAINLKLPAWMSVGLTAAVGLLPLTSFVSSYVQPDNLAYALVSASLFFGTEVASKRWSVPTVVGLGLALGVLAVTKYQFFLATAMPIVLLLVSRLGDLRSATLRAAAIAAVVAPAMLALGAQHWVVGQSDPTGRSKVISEGLFDYMRGIAALGPAAVAQYIAFGLVGALVEFFVLGNSMMSYWQVVGWGDTPIYIFSPAAEQWIFVAISTATAAVLVVVTFSAGRNLFRLARAIAGRHAHSALRVLVVDPVFASYACFVAIMLGLYVLTNNAFGSEGRQWYPFIFSALLCLVWYAPRALLRRHRPLSGALTCALLCYAAAAAGYALFDVVHRYYGPQAPYTVFRPMTSHSLATKDALLYPVESADYKLLNPPVAAFPVGSQLFIGGTALANGAPIVAVVIDGKLPLPVATGEYVYSFLSIFNRSYAHSGFYAVLGTDRLPQGAHEATAYISSASGQIYQRIMPTRLFFLTDPHGRFSRRFYGELTRAPTIAGHISVVGSCAETSQARGRLPSILAGGVVLLAGNIERDQAMSRYSGVWFLTDDRPYPARYEQAEHTFTGTIPTAGLTLGIHRVVAYAVHGGRRGTARISSSALFRLASATGAPARLSKPAPACRDPLKELAGG